MATMGFETIPVQHRDTIRESVLSRSARWVETDPARAESWEADASRGRWNHLSGYYGWSHGGVYFGCEPDGHIHT